MRHCPRSCATGSCPTRGLGLTFLLKLVAHRGKMMKEVCRFVRRGEGYHRLAGRDLRGGGKHRRAAQRMTNQQAGGGVILLEKARRRQHIGHIG